MISILKHPLCRGPVAERGTHLRLTRELELHIRRKSIPYPDAEALARWAERLDDAAASPWAEWVVRVFLPETHPETADLGIHMERHVRLTEELTSGMDESGAPIWERADGKSITDI
ncbi:MAG: double-strand break repair protein AddB, partial [Planctomycetes bacterium]|nr:double-strand break repair protein AddB [Planctomycetota bacterium]